MIKVLKTCGGSLEHGYYTPNLAVCFPLQLSQNAFGYVTRDIQAQYFDSLSVYMCVCVCWIYQKHEALTSADGFPSLTAI